MYMLKLQPTSNQTIIYRASYYSMTFSGSADVIAKMNTVDDGTYDMSLLQYSQLQASNSSWNLVVKICFTISC